MPEGLDEVRIEYVPLDEIRKWARNPKDHDLGLLHESFERFGYVAPMGLNEATGQLLWGHGRLKVMMQRKVSGEGPPDRVREMDGSWFVPVVRGISINPAEAEAYAIVDNRSSEVGGWDESRLVEVLSDLAQQEAGLAGVGFDANDLDALLSFTSFDDYEDLPDLDWEDPQKAYRVIIQCDDVEQFTELKDYLGLTRGKEDQVRYNFTEIVWPS